MSQEILETYNRMRKAGGLPPVANRSFTDAEQALIIVADHVHALQQRCEKLELRMKALDEKAAAARAEIDEYLRVSASPR